MKNSIRIIAGAVAIATLAAPAFAQRTPPTPEERAATFDAADANKDGSLDKAEFKTTIPEQFRDQIDDDRLGQFFDRIDADHDGKVTKAEFTAPRQRPGQ